MFKKENSNHVQNALFASRCGEVLLRQRICHVDNLPPLPEDFSGLNVVSCTPVLQGEEVLTRLSVEQMNRPIVIVDGVQRLMRRKLQKDGNWVYLVGLAAGAVEVWPKLICCYPP